MAKELDTSWFDLKNYDALKTMSTEGWIWQLIARDQYHKVERNRLLSHDKDQHDRYLSSIASVLKSGLLLMIQIILMKCIIYGLKVC